jgi:hypothetical protein
MKWLLVGILLLSGCTKDGFLQPKRDIEMSIDSKLPKDQNGYSVFSLYSTETQNIHTITGSIRVNGKIPNEPREKIEWESSHYWTLKFGETIGTIYRRQWRGLGWQIVDSIMCDDSIFPTKLNNISPTQNQRSEENNSTGVSCRIDNNFVENTL